MSCRCSRYSLALTYCNGKENTTTNKKKQRKLVSTQIKKYICLIHFTGIDVRLCVTWFAQRSTQQLSLEHRLTAQAPTVVVANGTFLNSICCNRSTIAVMGGLFAGHAPPNRLLCPPTCLSLFAKVFINYLNVSHWAWNYLWQMT